MSKIWTDSDNEKAMIEGWAVCEAFGSDRHIKEDMNLELSKIDDLQFFGADDEVWQHVCNEAQRDSELHIKALYYIWQNDVREARDIMIGTLNGMRAFQHALNHFNDKGKKLS